MSRYPHKNLPLKKADINKTPFEKKKTAKVGTKKSPVKLVVATTERKEELTAVCEENGWHLEVTIDPEQEENILDLTFLQAKQPTKKVGEIQNRNDLCACGSNKKFKKCCGAAQ